MIARNVPEKEDLWAQLSAPLPSDSISWRQDGRPMQRDGKYIARFVAYVDANTVRERLDSVVPGEWDLTLDMLPNNPATIADDDEPSVAFKARLQILGVIREDVGAGRDYKQAATDAFKRAAVRFGIAHELYAYEQNWVQVDGDGKYAKPLEDPAVAYARRMARLNAGSANGANGANAKSSAVTAPAAVPAAATNGNGGNGHPAAAPAKAETRALIQTAKCANCATQFNAARPMCPECGTRTGAAAGASAANDTPDAERIERGERSAPHNPVAPVASGPLASDEPSCPKCGGRVWDNRISKRNPKAPDFKCRSRSCDGVIWPPRAGGSYENSSIASPARTDAEVGEWVRNNETPEGLDDLPF